MSLQPDTSAGQQASTPQPTNNGVFARFVRSVSSTGKDYFSRKVLPSKSQPATPAVEESGDGTTTLVADTPAKSATQERAAGTSKKGERKAADFPPNHWITPVSTPISPSEDVAPMEGFAPSQPVGTDAIPDSTTLAQRIQDLLSNQITTSSNPPRTPAADDDNSPPPPMTSDPKLISFLSSPKVMNGHSSKNEQSVWSVLYNLRAKLPGQGNSTSAKSEDNKKLATEQSELKDDDDSSIMVYGPLVPTSDSHLEFAKAEMVQDDPHKASTPTEQTTNTSRVHVRRGHKVWVPSTEQISIEIMWWGYRIYLPPPVLNILDNKQLEGAKRAALLTASLKWALDRIPLMMVPLQARPAMAMFKKLTPYLGYIGGFIAWSWGTIKSFDKGNGVTLTATWLLSAAVIPGTWEDNEVPTVTKQPTTGGDSASTSAGDSVKPSQSGPSAPQNSTE